MDDIFRISHYFGKVCGWKLFLSKTNLMKISIFTMESLLEVMMEVWVSKHFLKMSCFTLSEYFISECEETSSRFLVVIYTGFGGLDDLGLFISLDNKK